MAATAAAGPPVYEDFVPSYKLVRDGGINTLVVELQEFTKEQIVVRFERFEKLIISGERPIADNRRSRFYNVFEYPKECTDLNTRFENGRLYVTVLPQLNVETSIEAAIKLKREESKEPTGPSTVAEKRDEPTDMIKKDKEVVKEKEKDQTEERKGEEKKFEISESGVGFSKPMQILVNVVVAVAVLVVMAVYMTSKD